MDAEWKGDQHQFREQVRYNMDNWQIHIFNVSPDYNYLLIANSLRLVKQEPKLYTTVCHVCERNVHNITYEFSSGSISQELINKELQDLKYCILIINKKTESYCRMLGITEQNDYLRGNLAFSGIKPHSQLFLQLVDNPNTLSASVQSAKEDHYKNQNCRHEIDPSQAETVSSSSISVMEQFTLYVTKMQCEVQNLYRSNMFHEYVWQSDQIQFTMEKVKQVFGQFKSIVQKRRYLQFAFVRNKTDFQFKKKWDNTSKQIMFRKNKVIEGKVLNYYLCSKQKLLQNEQQTSKLFLLPNDQKIVDLVISQPWVIIAADNFLFFLHNYRPMDCFKHQSNIRPTKIFKFESRHNNVVVMNKKGSFFLYLLTETAVILQAVYNIPFLMPYAMAEVNSLIAVAGLDLEKQGLYIRQNYSLKRRIYLMNKFMHKQTKLSNRSLTYKHSFQISEVSVDNRSIPITYIQALSQTDLVLCCWHNRVFVVNLEGQKIVEVELKAHIQKIIEVPFLFNLFNFVLRTEDGELIRMGIQSYGTGLGAELNRLKVAHATGYGLAIDGSSRYELYICQQKGISKASFLNQSVKPVLVESEGKIVNLACDRFGIAYLIDNQHAIEVKYLQI